MKLYGRLVLLSVLALAVTTPLAAQRGPRGIGGQDAAGAFLGLRNGGGIERILGLRDDLGLSEQQVTDLNSLRVDQLERRQEAAATMMRLRSDVNAGEIARSEMRDALREGREVGRSEAGTMREQIEQILTADQIEALAVRVRDARRSGLRNRRPGQMRGHRAGARGQRRANARRGRTARPERGFRRGGFEPFGRGFAPGRGFRRLPR